MGYVFDFNDAQAYADRCGQLEQRQIAERECGLMIDMLKPASGDSLLDIGCGTGINVISLLDLGVQVTGIDPSPYMLDIASKNLGNRVDLHRGYAEDLPFDDNSFNYATFITTMEFVEDPQKAIEEACRVAKDRVFLGVLNKYALKGIGRRIVGMFSASIYNRATFYGVWELKRLVRSAAGDSPLSWRTICQFPGSSGFLKPLIEDSQLVQRCPFGAFTGMVVTLTPRFRTRPMKMRIQSGRPSGAVTG